MKFDIMKEKRKSLNLSQFNVTEMSGFMLSLHHIRMAENGKGTVKNLEIILKILLLEIAGIYYKYGEPIGNYISRSREEKGLSLRQLSKLSGIHHNSIYNLEHGHHNATIRTLLKVLNTLDSDLEIRDQFQRKEAWTKKTLMNRIHNVVPIFDLDPANPGVGLSHVKSNHVFTIRDNGLLQGWSPFRKIYCNPPYQAGVISVWIKKGFDLIKTNEKRLIVYLIPSAIDTTYYQEMILGHSHVFFLKGKNIFERPTGEQAFGRIPSCLVIYQNGYDDVVDDFKNEFSDSFYLPPNK